MIRAKLDLIQVCLYGLLVSLVVGDEKSCSFTAKEGVVDLSPIANSDGSAKFTAQDPNGQVTYYWNPCNDFTQGDDGVCQNVEVCMFTASFGGHQNLGTKDDATFIHSTDGKLTLQYKEQFHTANIALKCGKGGDEFTFTSQPYNFQLESQHACYQKSPTKSPSAMSPGTYICIICLALVLTYLIGGILIMKFVKKANGSEILPNVMFWKSLPSLVKDGSLFIIRRGKTSSPSAYDSI